jgi:hypothetical protein
VNNLPFFKNLQSREHLVPADWAMTGALTMGLGLLFILYHDFALDDSFITYRYAENLARGEGFIYNPGQRNLGTTAPFYAILLASIQHLAPLPLPLIANLLSLLCLLSGAGLLYLLARRHDLSAAGACAGLLYASSPLLVTSTGMETSFCLLLVLSAVLASDGSPGSRFGRARLACAGVCLGLAVITRSDTVIVAGVLGLVYLWRFRALPWPTMLAALLVIGPFFLWLTTYFGSPLPGSLAAKQAQLALGFPSYAHGLVRYLAGARVGLEDPEVQLQPLVLITLLAGGGMAVAARSGAHSEPGAHRPSGAAAWWIWALAGWGLLHAAAYTVLGVPAYHWYYAPLEPGLCLLAGLSLQRGASALSPSVERAAGVTWRWAAMVVLAALVVGQMGVNVWAKREVFDPKARTYRTVGQWLETHAGAGADVAAMEVGLVGYYSRRPMVDLLGLIDPASRRALVRQDLLWPIAHYRPEYVVLTSHNPFYSVHLEEDAWFYEWYRPVHSQAEEAWSAAPVIIHARARPRPQSTVRDQTVPQGRLGRFRLLSYDLSSEQARPGGWVEVTLRWRREGQTTPRLRIFTHIIDDQFEIPGVSDLDIFPQAWREGETISTHHFLHVAPEVVAGRYYVEVGIYQPETLRRLAALDEEGVPTGAEIIVLQDIQVDS